MMGGLRRWLDRMRPRFEKGGQLEQFYVLYEMVDGFLFSPSKTTDAAPHLRDGVDLKRVMVYVVVAVFPALMLGMYNIGYQANTAMAAMNLTETTGWRGHVIATLGIGYNPQNIFACLVHGFLYFLPLYVVTLIAGGLWETLFAMVRNHEINEGFLVTSLLYMLTLPPNLPLWMVAVGISFGVVLGKEVYGGTGKNFMNPALVGRAFLFFAFPSYISGDAVWTAVDGFSGATPLALGAAGGIAQIQQAGVSWGAAFFGWIQGSVGATSTLACLLGAVYLIYTGVASWRIMAGCVVGLIATSFLFNLVGGSANPMFAMPWYWHFVLGGFAFGTVFMATDPVSAAQTSAGRWLFGILIGSLTVVVRVANPAYPEGIMLAILFGNVFAPLFDYFAVQANIRRRRLRYAQ